jgi:meiotic recombination protein SPO11
MVDIYQNLKNQTIRTKRDMFYGNSELYKKQSVIDAAVSRIADNLQVPRDALNVVGAAKGIYFGELEINNQRTHATYTSLLPRREEIDSLDLLDNRFVLVVEKDAVMSVIAEHYEQIRGKMGNFLLISGKGFPCMRTKQFLNLIECEYPSIPLFVLTDNDPYGIEIAINYATSSNRVKQIILNHH